MPKLWNQTIAAHRRAVQDAILDTTAALVADHGLASVTMSQVAELSGIGRATLYKYFPDLDAILLAWHERQVTRHFEQLVEVGSQPGDASKRLEAVLEAYARIASEHHGAEVAPSLHRGAHVTRAQQQLQEFVTQLVAEGAGSGSIRDDVGAEELAGYCLHAMSAASRLRSAAAVHRLVMVTLDGLRPQ
jgi:AcrR family transcriptional regulator